MASLALSASMSASSSTSRSASTSTTASWTSTPSLSPAPAPGEDSTIRFTTINKLFQQINHVQGDILIVTHVSPRDFAAIEQARASYRRKVRFRRYYVDTQILIITIPTALHESLHGELYALYADQLAQVGLRRSWRYIGSTTLRAIGHPGSDGGESDSAGGPLPARDGSSAWPTLVIEAGHSESLPQLRSDMSWWFDASNHQVKIVLLAKFNRSQGEIQLEKWEEAPQAVRPGAVTRSVTAAVAAGTPLPVLRQRITITRNAISPPSYNVTRGALVLSFGLLFLRAPGPGEGDFVLSIPDLQFYAERIWALV